MPPRAPACPLCCFLQPPACHRSPVGEPHILALPHLGHIRQWDDLRDSKQASGQAAQLQSNPAHVRDCRHFRSTAGRCNSFRAHRPGAQAACLDFLVAKQVAPAAGARRARGWQGMGRGRARPPGLAARRRQRQKATTARLLGEPWFPFNYWPRQCAATTTPHTHWKQRCSSNTYARPCSSMRFLRAHA